MKQKQILRLFFLDNEVTEWVEKTYTQAGWQVEHKKGLRHVFVFKPKD